MVPDVRSSMNFGHKMISILPCNLNPCAHSLSIFQGGFNKSCHGTLKALYSWYRIYIPVPWLIIQANRGKELLTSCVYCCNYLTSTFTKNNFVYCMFVYVCMHVCMSSCVHLLTGFVNRYCHIIFISVTDWSNSKNNHQGVLHPQFCFVFVFSCILFCFLVLKL